jgi:hypothetical protein
MGKTICQYLMASYQALLAHRPLRICEVVLDGIYLKTTRRALVISLHCDVRSNIPS